MPVGLTAVDAAKANVAPSSKIAALGLLARPPESLLMTTASMPTNVRHA